MLLYFALQLLAQLVPAPLAQASTLTMEDLCQFLASDESKVNFSVNPDGAIVTQHGRARVYPEELTLRNMGLRVREIERMEGNVLLVGEGYGSLARVFARSRTNLTLVDPLYGLDPIPNSFMRRDLAQFRRDFRGQIHAGTAFALPATNDSQDFVGSHMLLNNLFDQREWTEVVDGQEVTKEENRVSSAVLLAFAEMVRVAKPGSPIVNAGMIDFNPFIELVDDARRLGILGPAARITITETQTEFDFDTFGSFAPDFRGRRVTYPVTRIEVRK